MDGLINNKRKKKNIQYFTQETEDCIVLYNSTDDYTLKSKIYYTKIHYAFFKLTENIIHTFKFYYTEVDNIEDLQHEVMVFLLSKIHLYDQSKGYKAYSYFGTIAKRYLILYNQKNYKKKVEVIGLETIEEDEKHSYIIDEPAPEESLSIFMDSYIDYCTQYIFKFFPKEQDAQIADAVLELFRKRESLDFFNKKALYIYIREMVDVKTPRITKITTKLHIIFKKHYSFYLEKGYTNF